MRAIANQKTVFRRLSRGLLALPLLGAGLLAGRVTLSQPAAERPAPVWSLAFSPDGKVLAGGSYQRVQLWDAAAKTPLRTLSGHAGAVRCLAWSADGKQLAAGGGKPGQLGEVKIWNAAEEGAAPVTMQEHRDVVESVAFAGTGDAVLSASIDERALAVQLSTKKVLGTMQDHTNRVVGVAVSPSGKYVATGSLDKTVKIWGADFKPIANIDTGLGPVNALAFLPSGEQLAVAGEEGNLRIYRLSEARSGKLVGLNTNVVRTINGDRVPLLCLAISQKGNFLAVGAADNSVRVYDLNSGNRKYLLKECADQVYSVAFSPDGTVLAAGARDGKVRLWTTADGKPAGEL